MLGNDLLHHLDVLLTSNAIGRYLIALMDAANDAQTVEEALSVHQCAEKLIAKLEAVSSAALRKADQVTP